ncbi:Ig-like domain-containing protein [Sunxiuqinia sp. A32]|uniref:Ig-like domain-containing protein n=1 Tax=Sunxiuqinia sp. A32 TaxID=3461496 RepID=UPI004046023C
MKKIFPIIILSWLAYVIFTTSCANPGMPVGGDKDTIPPVLVETRPEINQRAYDGQAVSLTFDEFIIPDGLSEVLVVSPPIEKRPLIRTKSKTLIVDLGDKLKENTTYSLDFKNSIVDNNEKNPIKDFRFAFSTGEDFDGLMIGGYVKQADNLEPIEGALVLLHSLDSLSAFTDSIPDYIAKTDEEGFYIISNVAEGAYRLYALMDADNSLNFNQPTEQIAFYDTLVVPHDWNLAVIEPDSTKGIEKRVRELPNPHFLMMYEEDYFYQYLDDSKRDRANLCHFYFSESLSDTFKLELIEPQMDTDWSYFEFNSSRDSLQLWITDTIVSQTDTLRFRLDYTVKDTLDQFVYQVDTLELVYKEAEKKIKKKKKEEDEKPKTEFIRFNIALKDGFDVYKKILLEAPEPLKLFDYGKVHLFQRVDTIDSELEFDLVQDSLFLRKYYIEYPWEYETDYRLEIDSAAIKNFAGNPNDAFSRPFKTQKEGFYAKIILTLTNVRGKSMVELLENNDKEEVLQRISIDEDAEIEFPFLEPDKYRIRMFVDKNANGKWDKGKIEAGLMPEQVIYFPKILKLRSNFEVRESWALPQNLKYQKELVDEDEQKNKARKTGSGRARPN